MADSRLQLQTPDYDPLHGQTLNLLFEYLFFVSTLQKKAIQDDNILLQVAISSILHVEFVRNRTTLFSPAATLAEKEFSGPLSSSSPTSLTHTRAQTPKLEL